MTRLSVNVNKVASLRNARGGNNPNLIQVVKDCESYGAEGITVHPRSDERHITLNDVYDISKIVKTNYNIEGYPDNRFLKIIKDIKPEQATLVPDAPDVVTSNRGWKSFDDNALLRNVISTIHKAKGLEWNNVIIHSCIMNVFPHFYSRTDSAQLEDARLLYVAMTRAKKKLTLLIPSVTEYGRPANPSPFIFDPEIREMFEIQK